MPFGYNRKAPYLLMMANRYSHAKQMKRKRKMLKQLKTLVGGPDVSRY
ncbi:Transposase, IS4 family [Methylomonas fluvii]|nr:Transposase, IS4 family [Methylomonas fluvii]